MMGGGCSEQSECRTVGVDDIETWRLPATTPQGGQLESADTPIIKQDCTTILVVFGGFASIASAVFAQRSQRLSLKCLGTRCDSEAIESFVPASRDLRRPSIQY